MNSFLLRRENPLLVAKTSPVFGGKSLDIGCGSGANSKFMETMGYTPYCIDIDPQAIAIAKAHGLLVHQMSMVDFQWTEKYDMILFLYVLQHVTKEQAIELIENAVNHLYPNGFIHIGIFDNEINKIKSTDIEKIYSSNPNIYLFYRQYWHMLDCDHGKPHHHECDYFIIRSK